VSVTESGPRTPRAAETPGTQAGGEPVVAAWRTLAARYHAVNCALEQALARYGLGVSEFEVLDRLTDSPARKFRAQELAEAVHLSQSALSRLIDRLVKHGLVERCLCGEDRRGIYVIMTEAGQQRHAEAAPAHRAALARELRAATPATTYFS